MIDINISDSQGGGQKGKSTSDHIAKLSNFINTNQRKKMKPLIAFLDVTKAYDKAWMQAILYTLHKSGIKGQD